MKFAKVTSEMFNRAIKDYNLIVKGSYGFQGFIEVYDGDVKVGTSERGMMDCDYSIDVKYLINNSTCA